MRSGDAEDEDAEDAPEVPGLFRSWSNNCRGVDSDELYIFHAYLEGVPGKMNITLCGVEVQEIGEAMRVGGSIACRRCRRTRLFVSTMAAAAAFAVLSPQIPNA